MLKEIQPIILKDLIKKSGLKTQKAFAKKHKIDASFLSEVMTGKCEYRSSTLQLIAMDEGYEIELHYLLKTIKQK
jgi:hypothetical protein